MGYVVLSKEISMKVERIEVVKNWPKPKSVCNIQVFLGFVNFYWQFIKGFSKIATLFTLILKTIGSSDKLAFGKNNSSKLASRKNNGNGEVDKFGGDNVEPAKKSAKLKGQKSAKSRKSSKSGKFKGKKPKKPSKSWNSPNFGAMESRPNFLIPKARSAFNRLWLAFTKAPILQYFDLECHIWIKTNVLGYVISGVLSQLASGTSLNEVVTKTDLSQWHPIAFF